MPSDQAPTLRERLRLETHSLIADAAERLFGEYGFRDVTVDAVAREAGVSRQTVFNHFPVKEDLVFDRAGEFEELVVAGLRDRPAGVGVVDAFRAPHRAFWSRLHSLPDRLPDPQPRGGFFHLVAASPALQAYGRELNARTAQRIADAIAAPSGETRDDLRPRVIADALLSVYAATFDAIQRQIVAGEHPRCFLDAILDQADASLDLLNDGIRAFP